MNKFYIWLTGLAAASLPQAAMGAYTVPFSITPTQAQFNECTIEDVDGDGNVAVFDSSEGAFQHKIASQSVTDDYLFMPAVTLQPGSYKLKYEFKTRSDKECFAIVLATAPASASVTQVIQAKEEVSIQSYDPQTVTFEVAEAGDYHLGIHFYSQKNRWNFWLRNFNLTIIDNTLPKTPQLSLTADGLDVTASLTFPSENIAGEALSGTLTANLLIDDAPAATLTGAPGETKSTVITCTSGTHKISANVVVTKDGVEKPSEFAVADIATYRKCPDPLTVPVDMAMDYDEFTWCTVINNNNDNNTWEFANSGMPDPVTTAIRYSAGWTNAGDDYLILPAIELAKGAYEVSVEVGTKYQVETFEVYTGTEPTVESLSQNKIGQFSENLSNTWKRVKFLLPVSEAGRRYIAFRATSPTSSSYVYLRGVKVDEIDATAPVAPELAAAFDGGDGVLKVTLPATDLVGTPLTASVVKAVVSLDGTEIETPLSGAPGEVVEAPCTGLTKGAHSASAYVYFERDGEQVKSESTAIDFKIGLPSTFAYSMPVELSLGSDMFDDMVIVNANGDNYTWECDGDAMKYHYSTSNPGDDWAFTAPVDIQEIEHLINISVEAKAQSSSNIESFEIWLGTAQNPESMTMKILDAPSILNTEFIPQAEDFMLSTPGKYVIGIHEVSAANRYNLFLKNLKLSYTDKPNTTPNVATGITAAGNITGALDATVTFTMPTVNVPGEELEADKELTATVSSPVETKTVTGLPGSEQSVTLLCNEGENLITITVSNEFGEGKAAYTTARCGLDKPKTPVLTKSVVSDDNCTLHIEWAAVTEGQTGGNANPDGVDYYIWEYDPDDDDWYQLDVFSGRTSYDYELSDGYKDELSHVIIGVQAYNGLNSGSGIAPAEAVLGKPCLLDMKDDFAGFRFAHKPVTLTSSLDVEYRPEWGLGDPTDLISTAVSENGSALMGRTSFNRGDSYVVLPKFSTEGMTDVEARFSIYVYPLTPEFTLVYRDAEGKFNSLATFETAGLTSGWNDFVTRLPEQLIGKPWVELALFVNFTNGSAGKALIDSYAIGDPATVGIDGIGAGATFSVIAADGGVIVEGAQGRAVTVYAMDGRTVLTVTPASGSEHISLMPGNYLVACGNAGKAVAVK